MNIDEIVEEIRTREKYAGIDPAVVRRVCLTTEGKYPKKKDVVKAAKNELHSIHASFMRDGCYAKGHAILARLPPDCDRSAQIDIGMQMMQLHASTKERLGEIREIYAMLSRYITKDSTVMDIGCGFNPFALPLLDEMPKSVLAYDIALDTINLLNAYFSRTNQPMFRAEILDAVVDTPTAKADAALMLKLLPLLQQQKKGRAFSILADMNVDRTLVSFPLKSMSGKQKGMETFYTALMEDNLPSTLKIHERHLFSNEMFYVVGR